MECRFYPIIRMRISTVPKAVRKVLPRTLRSRAERREGTPSSASGDGRLLLLSCWMNGVYAAGVLAISEVVLPLEVTSLFCASFP